MSKIDLIRELARLGSHYLLPLDRDFAQAPVVHLAKSNIERRFRRTDSRSTQANLERE